MSRPKVARRQHRLLLASPSIAWIAMWACIYLARRLDGFWSDCMAWHAGVLAVTLIAFVIYCFAQFCDGGFPYEVVPDPSPAGTKPPANPEL